MLSHPLIFAGAYTLAAWLYLVAGRGRFWFEFLRSEASGQAEAAAGPLPSILAIVPARNEAALVGRAIGSLANQQYAGRFHIVLVDDDSSDGTAEAARAAAAPELLTVVRARPLPSGWTGKLWAIAEGIRQAPFQPDCLLLSDADIVHPPENLRALAARLDKGYDLVSFMATLACDTTAERALIPAFVFFFFLLYPPAWVRSRRHAAAGAAGGCILIRRAMLDQIGGIEAIRAELIDDCALAGAVKRHGGRVWLGLSSGTRSIRPYASFREIGRMISRSAFTQLRHSPLLLAGTTLGLVATFLLPPLLTVFAPRPAAALGAGAWLLMSIAYFPVVRFYRCRWFWAPLLPFVAAFYLCATFHSAFAYWRGTGGLWKGRVQDVPSRAS
jgi:hopene-associated glycosyltransferase HpnB